MPQDIWLGAPQQPPTDDIMEIETSRIGGNIFLFRECENAQKYFQCPKCHSSESVSLLAHLFAPTGCDDRVIYVLTCSSCSRSASAKLSKGDGQDFNLSKSRTSVCFALRSQNFNRKYFEEKKAAHEREAESKRGIETALFAEDVEWGDEEDGDAPLINDIPQKTNEIEPFSLHPKDEFLLAKYGSVLQPKSGIVYTNGLPLDIFKEKIKDIKLVEEEVHRKFGDVSQLIEQSEGEIDDASKVDKWIQNYMDRIQNNPTQCVRWCPGGQPLRTSLEEIAPPPCSKCGGKLQFELQLTAPVVYYLTREVGEGKNEHLHFSNVIVYTCSQNCNGADAPYIPQFTYVEDEL